MARDYSKCTDEQFDAILERLVGEMSASQILSYGDVNAFFREELNNQVLEEWEQENPPSKEEQQEQFLKDVLCGAYEGGIDYWAAVRNLKRDVGPDFDYLSFEVRDSEDSEDEWRPVNTEIIKNVISKLQAGDYQIADDHRANILQAWEELDAGQIDADYADLLVQLAAYGENRFC